VKWREDGEPWPTTCYICDDELHRYDSWGVALCARHSMRAGILFPETVGQVT
jgi:hypothetical protein